jgi:predicted ATPase
MGEFPLARAHLEHSLALYDPQQHRAYGFVFDPGVDSLCTLARVLQLLGYPDQALRRSQEALTLARELAHPFSLSVALRAAASVHHRRGELPVAQALHAEGLALCREQGFAQETAQGMLLHGWGLVAQGRQAEGIAQMRQGLDAVRVTGAESDRLWMLSLLAAACRHTGQVEEGLGLVAEALAMVHHMGKHVDASGLYRLKGDLLLQGSGHTLPSGGPGHASEAEACFRQAFEVARRQHAKALELRAAMSLSRLWQRQGKRAEAYDLLAPIYSWFTEGFDTTDLQEAKALLEELA